MTGVQTCALPISEIRIVEKEEALLVTVDIDEHTTFEKEVELITAETARYRLGRLHDASYGSMIPVSSLLEGNFDAYSKLFIEMPFLACSPKLHIAPKGQYLRAFHQGGWEEMPKRYEEIFRYAKEHGLKPYGFSYEMGINESVIDRIQDYILQIEIPVAVCR